MKLTILILIAALNLTALVAQQQTTETKSEAQMREQQIARQIKQGEARWLNDGNSEFLSLFCASLIETKGSMLWLAAPNQTVLSPGIMRTICDYYPTVGWQILSIAPAGLVFSRPQLEVSESVENADASADKATYVLANPKEWYESQDKANLDALVKRLVPAEREILATNSGYILVANSASASIVLEAISSQQIRPAALVLLNVSHPNDFRQNRINLQLNDLTLPVLDIYHVKGKTAAYERYRYNKGRNYTQHMVPGLYNDFRGVERQVIDSIEGWLKKLKI